MSDYVTPWPAACQASLSSTVFWVCVCVCVCVCESLSRARLFVTPWTIACQGPLSMGIFQARLFAIPQTDSVHGILQARILEWTALPFGDFPTLD